MKAIRTLLDRSLQALCSALLLCMVGVASWQVISRYLLNSPSTTSEALLRFCLIWISMMAIAYVSGRRGHVSLTLLTDKLTGKASRIFEMIIELIFLAFSSAIFVYGGYQAAANSMGQTYPMLQIPKGMVYVSLPVTGVIICIYCILNCVSIYKKMPIKEVGVS